MSFYLDTPEAMARSGSVGVAGAGVSDNADIFDATIDEMIEVEAEGIEFNVGEAYKPVVDAMNASRSFDKQMANPFLPNLNATDLQYRRKASIGEIWQEVERQRTIDPQAFPDLPATHDELVTKTKERLATIVNRQRDLSARGRGIGAFGAELTGGALGALANPLVASSLFLGAPIGAGFLRFVATEAAIGGATEAALLPGVANTRERIGVPLTFEEGALRVGFGAVGGGAVAGTIKGGGRLFGTKTKPPLQRAAEEQQAHYDELAEELPADLSPIETDRQIELVEQAARGLVEERLADLVPDQVGPKQIAPGDDSGLYTIPADQIEVDADLFQFKAGGDAEGVTERLHGVTEWEPDLAGLVMVYEFADGRMFIADGHQRLGLARRLMAQGHEPINMNATVTREVDGISPAEARVAAAMKNIANESGTAIDAAKVLRVAPDRLAKLPPRSTMTRDAKGMMSLSDELFGMAINDVVPPRYAAIVGRLIPDQGPVQDAAMRTLVDVKPDNLTQAESVVRMVRENDVTVEVQEGLFGEEITANSLIKERTLVLDHALRALRRDKGVFNTLAKQAETIEDAGNTLNRTENAQRARTDDQAIAILLKAATVKGGISDALTDAAKSLHTGTSRAAAVDQFVGSVRRAVAAGDLNGIGLGGSRSGLDAEGPRYQAEDEGLDLFSEPAGAGQQAQAARIRSTILTEKRPRAEGREDRFVVNPEEADMPLDQQIEFAGQRISAVIDAYKAGDGTKHMREYIMARPERRQQAEDAQGKQGKKPLKQVPLPHGLHVDEVNKFYKDHVANPDAEIRRGNLPSELDDLYFLPYLVTHATPIPTGKSDRGLTSLLYRGLDESGVLHVVEEIRGTDTLSFKTAYRKKWKSEVPDSFDVPPIKLPALEALRPKRGRGLEGNQSSDDLNVKSGGNDLFDGVPLADQVIDGVQVVRGIDEIDAESAADEAFITEIEGCKT